MIKMGRNKRLDYGLIAGLYESDYGQTLIGKILETPSGHISKVLKVEGVQARKRGERVIPEDYEMLSGDLKQRLKLDEEVFQKYQEVMGYEIKEEQPKREWKELEKSEKFEIIMDKLDQGMTTREASKEIGIAQSTLVKTKNSYLKETSQVG